jgi:endoglucanase
MHYLSIVLITLLHISLPPAEGSKPDRQACYDIFRTLGPGMNFGNALEAPKEGEWGLKLESAHFKIIKEAGFRSIRVPVKWSAHAAKDAPFTIDPSLFKRIDWVLDQAEANKLSVVLNCHHYDEMDKEPDKHLPRLIGLWQQIAGRYKDRPDSVVFELLNEPHDKLVDDKWNEAIPPLLKAVRGTNPTRPVIVGPPFWNGIWALPKLKLPDDPNLIVTVHFYEPYKFTHQGAPWASEDVRKLSGFKWEGTEAEVKEIRTSFDRAADWASKNNRPVYLGEFGSFEKADMASRAKWTSAIVHEAGSRGFRWAYWEFAAGFGAYDRDAKSWRDPLLKALIPASK